MIKVTDQQAAAVLEIAKRRNMGLRLFRSQPQQDAFFKTKASTFLIRGGNRSTESETIFWKVGDAFSKVETRGRKTFSAFPIKAKDIKAGDVVVGYDYRGKRHDMGNATILSVDRYTEDGLLLKTRRGYELKGTIDHPVWACPPKEKGWHNGVDPDHKKGQWVLLKDLEPGWFVRLAYGPYTDQSFEQDDEAYFHGLMEGDGSYGYKYGVMKLTSHCEESAPEWTASYLESHGVNSKLYKKQDSNGVSLEWCNKEFKERFNQWKMPQTPEAISSYLRGLFDSDGCFTTEDKVVFIQKDESVANEVHQLLLLFGIKSSLYLTPANESQKRPNPTYRLQISGASVCRYVKSIGFNEPKKKLRADLFKEKRSNSQNGRLWWDRIESVTKAPSLDICAFETSLGTYISNGIVSHNSGKSTSAAVAFASIACDIPVTLSDGTEVNLRRPHQRGKPLVMWVIGYDQKHIGQTIYRLLFKMDLFQIIRDKETNSWRTFRRWDPEDAERIAEAKPSPPLIPSNYAPKKNWAWEDAAKKVFERVTIQHPQTKQVLAEIFTFSSRGEVKAGDAVDVIWIDEKIEYPEHVAEWQMRLVDKNGWIFWSSWPAIDNDALQNISRQAEECIAKGKTTVQECVLTSTGNKQIDQEALSDKLSQLSEEERQARDLGLYVTDRLRMYPLFDKAIHSAIFEDGRSDALSEYLKSRRHLNFAPGNDWTHELILDPGTNNPAILLCAIPPPNLGEYFVVYDELVPGRADADQLAEMLKKKVLNSRFFRFIIDAQAGRQTPMSFSVSIMQNYSTAFQKRGIMCETTGSNFILGSNQVGARIGMLQSWLHLNKEGMPKLRIVTENCVTLCKQLRSYMRENVAKNDNEFKPANGQRIDTCQCLEYWAASFPTHVFSTGNNTIERSPAILLLETLKKRNPSEKAESECLGASFPPIPVGFD